MSSSVSPCQWRYRGSGSIEPKGLTHSREAAFLRTWQSGDVDSIRTPPPAAPPLSALRAAGENIATYPLSTAHLSQKTRLIAQTAGENLATLQPRTHRLHNMLVQLHQSLTINPKIGKIASLRIKKEGAFSLTHLLQYEKFIYDSFLPSESYRRPPFRCFCCSRKSAS